MPVILVQVLAWFAASLVARMLMGAGLALYSISWVNTLVANAQAEIEQGFSSLPADVFSLLATLKVPQAISVIFSALVIVGTIKTAKVILGKAT